MYQEGDSHPQPVSILHKVNELNVISIRGGLLWNWMIKNHNTFKGEDLLFYVIRVPVHYLNDPSLWWHK